jgi:beta-xylosidase
MYYAPELKNQTGIHCISLATSTQPGGPYIDTSSEPMICPAADGGAIDPAFYRDLSPADGSCYVLYKIDTPNNNKGHTMCDKNTNHMRTPIMLQQVDCNSGQPTNGGPTEIYNNNGDVDRWNIEAPSLYRGSDGTYFLFYSCGCYSNESYTWNYVTSQFLKGPYGNPQSVVRSGEKGNSGPGGADIVLGGAVPGAVAWHSLRGSDIKNGRQLNVGTMQYNGASAQVV